MAELITSFANPTVKRVRALADRKHRRQQGAFVVEGLQPVWRAVTSGWTIESLVTAPELLTNEPAREMLAEQGRRGVRVVEVSREVFIRLSDRDGPAGLLAVVRGSVTPLADFRPGTGPVVALDRAGNPGNVGTIMRTADAAGAGGVALVGPSADPFAPSAVKASMGSLFSVPTARGDAPDDLFDWAEGGGRPVLAVTGHGREQLWRTALDPDAVLLFGSEGSGLPDDLADRCAAQVSIPMQGTAESLNLAAAVTVVLYELKRRRDAAPGT